MKDLKMFKKNRKSINGGVISYFENERQQKPTLVFLHPFPFNKNIWEAQINYFEKDYHVIAPDFRGFGNSPVGYKSLSVDLLADDLQLLLDSIDVSKAIICGLSLGGYVALNFVNKYPDMVQALVLADTQCREDTKLEITNRYKTVDEIIAYGLHYFSEILLAKLVSNQSFRFNAGLMRKLKEMIYTGKKDAVVFTILALARRDDTCKILTAIDKPTLVMVGEEDKITPVNEARYLHENIRGSVLRIIPNAGHLSNVDNASMFNENMASYLDYIGANKKRRVA